MASVSCVSHTSHTVTGPPALLGAVYQHLEVGQLCSCGVVGGSASCCTCCWCRVHLVPFSHRYASPHCWLGDHCALCPRAPLVLAQGRVLKAGMLHACWMRPAATPSLTFAFLCLLVTWEQDEVMPVVKRTSVAWAALQRQRRRPALYAHAGSDFVSRHGKCKCEWCETARYRRDNLLLHSALLPQRLQQRSASIQCI